MFQSVLAVPPKSTIYLTIDVSKIIPPVHEHPPDAQRGWDLPPAVLVPLGVRENQTIDQGTRYREFTLPSF